MLDLKPTAITPPVRPGNTCAGILGRLVRLPFDALDDLEIRGTEHAGDAIWHAEAKVQRDAGAKQILHVDDLVTDVKRHEGQPARRGLAALPGTVESVRLLAALEAESKVVEAETLAQRYYNVHQATFGHSGTAGNTIEDFIAALEQKEQTGGAEPS